MIIKCLSRKSNVGQLIRYVLTAEKLAPVKAPSKSKWYVPGVKLTKNEIKHLEAEKGDRTLMAAMKAFKGTVQEFFKYYMSKEYDTNKQNPVIIKNNIRARTVNGYIREFEANEKFRLHTRKDSVLAFHTIISFSALDSKHLTEPVLKDLAQKYISLRAEQSLVIGAVHRDRENTVHMHLVQSGVQYCTGVANRISRQQLHELKTAMQSYQLQKYPQLGHSLPEHGRSKNGKSIEPPAAKNIKSERSLDKDILIGLLRTTYDKSISVEHFYAQLREKGHMPYFRNGRAQGIKFEGERKFRWSGLGYLEKLQELDLRTGKEEKSLHEIRQLRSGRGKGIEVHRSLRQEVTKETDETRQRDKPQELVDRQMVFEAKNGITREYDPIKDQGIEMQELRDLRENRGKEMDRNSSVEQNGRDADEDRSLNDRDTKEDIDDRNDTDMEDEDLNNSQDDDSSEDDDSDVR